MTGKLLDTTVLIDLLRGNTYAADFTLLHLSPVESAEAYALVLVYNKSHGLTIPDAFIAATAIAQGLQLATDNDRHFQMIPKLTAERPY
jgi:predicted nucleic acid-binding protein